MKKILFLFILAFSLISLIIHNNFSTTQNISIYSDVAEPIFNISFEDPVTLDNSNVSVQYTFKISNYKNDKISDIPFHYYFYIEKISNDFSVKCYMDSYEITLSDFKSESFLLNNLYKEEHIFTVYINYIGNFTTSIFSNANIKIFYEQSNF